MLQLVIYGQAGVPINTDEIIPFGQTTIGTEMPLAALIESFRERYETCSRSLR